MWKLSGFPLPVWSQLQIFPIFCQAGHCGTADLGLLSGTAEKLSEYGFKFRETDEAVEKVLVQIY